MIAIERTLVSEDLLEKKFICDLGKCKGACCVEGTSGAPLEFEEIKILEDIYEKVKPYMNKEGIAEIDKVGVSLIDDDGEYVTPLVDGNKHCAFVVFDKGIAKCSIEKAFYDGIIDFKKPVSCHLYPVRITKYKDYDAVNIQPWNVCKPAYVLGKKADMPVYRFLEEPLIRRFGKDWYDQLKIAAEINDGQK
jgi:hypothetical protein